MRVGEKQLVDVDKNGSDDIGVEVKSIAEDSVVLGVWTVAPEAKADLNAPKSEDTQQSDTTGAVILIYLIGSMGAVFTTALLVRRLRSTT